MEQSFRQAFVNECVASIRYEYFADQADLDGLTTLADMFRSVARSEKKQAMELYNLYVSETGVDPINQLKVESSEDMLEAARQIEAQDADVFYPTLVSMANTEPDCEWLGEHFSRFADAEARHKEGVEYCYESLFPEEEDSEIEQ